MRISKRDWSTIQAGRTAGLYFVRLLKHTDRDYWLLMAIGSSRYQFPKDPLYKVIELRDGVMAEFEVDESL